jgi:S-adenosylmethionine decarboxylase
MTTEAFGVHIMLDGYDADAPVMRDAAALERLLRDLPGEMGMHPICAPVVVEVGPNCAKDPGGLSGFVMIAESHISFHTFPARRFVTMDLYTCRTGTDVQAVVARLTAAFGLRDVEVHVQRRGLRYPAEDLAA